MSEVVATLGNELTVNAVVATSTLNVQVCFTAPNGGSGDMTKAIYDPAGGERQVAFANEIPAPITVDTALDSDSENAVQNKAIAYPWDVTKFATGIQSKNDLFNKDLLVSYSEVTNKVTITGAFQAVYKGRLILDVDTSYEVPLAVSPVVGVKNYFLVYGENGYEWMSNGAFHFDQILICYLYFRADGTYLFGLNEAHGLMPWQSHSAEHNTIGTWRVSGGDVTGITIGITTAADRRPLVSNVVLRDEDKDTEVTGITVKENYTVAYCSDVEITSEEDQAEILKLSGSIPQYNLFTGGSWGLTDLPNNNSMSIWGVAMPVTNDAKAQKRRIFWVTGQSVSSTNAQELSKSPLDLDLCSFNNISPEFNFFAQIVVRRTGGNWTVQAVRSLTGSRSLQVSQAAGNALTAVNRIGVNLTGSGTAADPLKFEAADWAAETLYRTKQLIIYQSQLYRVTNEFTSGLTFDATNLEKLKQPQKLLAEYIAPTDIAAVVIDNLSIKTPFRVVRIDPNGTNTGASGSRTIYFNDVTANIYDDWWLRYTVGYEGLNYPGNDGTFSHLNATFNWYAGERLTATYIIIARQATSWRASTGGMMADNVFNEITKLTFKDRTGLDLIKAGSIFRVYEI
jgi:hypothetical protein